MGATFGSLFSGIGGLDLGLERAGWECRWQVEIDPFCRQVLAKHWPDVPRYTDVKELDPSDLEPVDLICGGFPCQPVSRAGKRLAQADDRWLWPEFARVVRGVGPRFVLVENVPGLLTRYPGLDRAPVSDVLGELASLGFDAEWESVPAASVGAPHIRERVFIVGHRPAPPAQWARRERVLADTASDRQRRDPNQPEGRSERQVVAVVERGGEDVADADREGLSILQGGEAVTELAGLGASRGGGWWHVEPDVGRVADGIPARVDRLRALGNAVVPQVAEWIGRQLLAALHEGEAA